MLSLNRRYESVVVPRVRRFLQRCPEIASCAQLLDRMNSLGAQRFVAEILDTNDARRADTLMGVVRYALNVQTRFTGGSEDERLRAWAADARPGDFATVGVHGFGLAGFQYLRMHFGADTCKPDIHIVRFVASAIGRKVNEVHALLLLEQVARVSGESVRRLDGLIWESAARA